MVKAAEKEFAGNVVTVDPDQLRSYHPDIDALREAHLYTWSVDTNADAGRWAGKLRELAVEGRRNLIIDTTLAKAEPFIKQIKTMQAQGYEVEVRVMAAHRLESQLGIDQRFTRSLDRKGYGRHVPSAYHDLAYDAPARQPGQAP